jgi:hypothetical protein
MARAVVCPVGAVAPQAALTGFSEGRRFGVLLPERFAAQAACPRGLPLRCFPGDGEVSSLNLD